MADTCADCGKRLSPEERLLGAIFGEEARCTECAETSHLPKCELCGEPTMLSINGKPRCRVHMGKEVTHGH